MCMHGEVGASSRQGRKQWECPFFVLRGSIASRFRAQRRSFSAPKKRPHFEVRFPDAKLAPPDALKLALASVPSQAFFCPPLHVLARVPSGAASLCLPMFPFPHGHGLFCTPALVACALRQRPVRHSASVFRAHSAMVAAVFMPRSTFSSVLLVGHHASRERVAYHACPLGCVDFSRRAFRRWGRAGERHAWCQSFSWAFCECGCC